MDDRFTHIASISPRQEQELLRRFVDAVLAADQELDLNEPQDWSEALLRACRRQRHTAKSRRPLLVGAC